MKAVVVAVAVVGGGITVGITVGDAVVVLFKQLL